LTTDSLLRASHIKPWRDCSDEERLDFNNGLLLIPNLDVAFEQYLIFFDDKGKILISRRLNETSKKILGINDSMSLRKFTPPLMQYIMDHREFFERYDR